MMVTSSLNTMNVQPFLFIEDIETKLDVLNKYMTNDISKLVLEWCGESCDFPNLNLYNSFKHLFKKGRHITHTYILY